MASILAKDRYAANPAHRPVAMIARLFFACWLALVAGCHPGEPSATAPSSPSPPVPRQDPQPLSPVIPYTTDLDPASPADAVTALVLAGGPRDGVGKNPALTRSQQQQANRVIASLGVLTLTPLSGHVENNGEGAVLVLRMTLKNQTRTAIEAFQGVLVLANGQGLETRVPMESGRRLAPRETREGTWRVPLADPDLAALRNGADNSGLRIREGHFFPERIVFEKGKTWSP